VGNFDPLSNRKEVEPNDTELKETRMGMAIVLLLLIATFTAIVIWVFARKQKARFAKDSRIPLEEDSREPPSLRRD
jgi:cbb3-type cytochrome oxidase subunit 3